MKNLKGAKYLPFAGLYFVQGFLGAFMGKALADQIAQVAASKEAATALITLLGQVASAAWILKILIAPVLDTVGRRARPLSFWFSTTTMALAVGLAAVSSTTTALAVAVAAATFGKALQDVVVDQLALDRFSDQREFARCQAVTVASLVGGGVLGGTVMVKLGAQVPWAVLCSVVALGVIVVSAASAAGLRLSGAENPQRPRGRGAGVTWSRTLLFALLVALTLNLAQGLTGPAVSPWLKSEVGLGKADRAEVYFVNDLCRIAGSLLALALARAAWSRHAKLIGVCLLLAGSYIGVAIGEPVWSSRLWLAALVGMTGVAEGLWLSTYLAFFRGEIKVGSRAPATQWQLLMVAVETSDLIAKSIGGPVYGSGVKFATLALMAGIAQLLTIPAVLRHRRASR